MPAGFDELIASAVSSAPQSLPPTQVTCCMRVSLLSRLADFSAKGSLMPSSPVLQELLLRQSRSGWVPDFCSDDGGMAYRPTSSLVLCSASAGDPLSELVLVSAQTRSCVEGWLVLLPSPVSCASAAPLELRKYSVPPADASPPPPGVCDGHRVKPLSANPKVSSPWVSNWVTPIVAGVEASCDLENAYTCAPWNSGPKKEYSLVVM